MLFLVCPPLASNHTTMMPQSAGVALHPLHFSLNLSNLDNVSSCGQRIRRSWCQFCGKRGEEEGWPSSREQQTVGRHPEERTVGSTQSLPGGSAEHDSATAWGRCQVLCSIAKGVKCTQQNKTPQPPCCAVHPVAGCQQSFPASSSALGLFCAPFPPNRAPATAPSSALAQTH